MAFSPNHWWGRIAPSCSSPAVNYLHKAPCDLCQAHTMGSPLGTTQGGVDYGEAEQLGPSASAMANPKMLHFLWERCFSSASNADAGSCPLPITLRNVPNPHKAEPEQALDAKGGSQHTQVH